jgi:CspA family cold shock protein
MHTGTVKTFDAAKGHGTIASDDGGKELHVRASSINTKGIKTLQKNQKVSFDLVPSPRGDQAANIRLIE